MKAYEKLSLEEKLQKTVSLDAGIKNILTIYNSTGKQIII